MKQWRQARLHTVPPTWNQSVSSARSVTLGGACAAGAASEGAAAGAAGEAAGKGGGGPGDAAGTVGMLTAHNRGGRRRISPLRYDRTPLRRFLVLALPTLVLA